MSAAKMIWINGAFGSGKTTMAHALYKRLPEAFIFDPENAGYYLRKNQPARLCRDNFQDEPLWRHINRDLLLHIATHYQGVILVPMTVIRPDYYNELVSSLQKHDIPVVHIVLAAGEQTLRRRLRKRLEGKRSWAAQQIKPCLEGFQHPLFRTQIQTDGRHVEDIAEEIARIAGLPLLPRRRGILLYLRRFGNQLRHIHSLIA